MSKIVLVSIGFRTGLIFDCYLERHSLRDDERSQLVIAPYLLTVVYGVYKVAKNCRDVGGRGVVRQQRRRPTKREFSF